MPKSIQNVKVSKGNQTRDRKTNDNQKSIAYYLSIDSTKYQVSTANKPHDTSQGIDGDQFLRLYRDRKLTELSKMLDSYRIESLIAQIFMSKFLTKEVK